MADLFGVDPGTMLLERRFVFYTEGVPQQMSTSCLLSEMVAGTPVAAPDREPWPGGDTAQLHSLGVVITGIRERVRARMPIREETEALRIPVVFRSSRAPGRRTRVTGWWRWPRTS